MATKFLAQLTALLHRNKATAPKPLVIRVGAVINQRYRLDAELGRGGMGIVYRAYDLTQNKTVALKVINFYEANALSYQQFAREAQVVAQLSHPHIVAVYEIGEVELAVRPTPFIAMEFVSGTNLAELRGLTYARIIDLGQQICEALAYAHAQGFIHRDLKPSNVLLAKQGFRYFAKLADFGLARPRDQANLPLESNLAGTVFYLAPEIIAGQPADVSSDLYALGATLYEMITARVPFSDFDESTILTQHLQEPVSPPSQSRRDVPPALETIVMRLLAKNPQERFASVPEVQQAFAQVPLPSPLRGNLLRTSTPPNIDLAHLLIDHKLITLLTDDETLALATAHYLREGFTDGVWQISLKAITDPTQVLPTVAALLNTPTDPAYPPAVVFMSHLHEKNLLLVFTQCEHLLGACAQLAETIMRTCPEVRLIVLSKEPLKVVGEKIYLPTNETQ